MALESCQPGATDKRKVSTVSPTNLTGLIPVDEKIDPTFLFVRQEWSYNLKTFT